MNLTKALLRLVVSQLRELTDDGAWGTNERETLEDAADALADAVDMLAELGEL